MSEKDIKIEIETPWGSYNSDSGWIAFIKHTKAQLEFFLEQGVTPDPEFTKKEIEGYQTLIETKDEELVKEFLDTKQSAILEGKPFESNFAVIEHVMKKKGLQ